ncbi:MAG: MaoC/PaaZ C-terminal domain-containing protein [bacterium]
MNDRPHGLFYEDLEEGASYVSKARTVTEADVVNFAGISGDFNELHMNDEHAKKTAFGKRIAHGMLGLSICSGLVQQLDLYNDTLVAFLGLNWSFKKPIFIGDTVHAVQTIKSKRETRNPARGIVVLETSLKNQDGEVVQEGERTVMIRTRAGG